MSSPPKRGRGRPRERTDRWYALFALLYLWVNKALVDEAYVRRRSRLEGRITTMRQLMREESSLSWTGVTNALSKAETEAGVFTREPDDPPALERTGPRRGLYGLGRDRWSGRITPKGWSELGTEIPSDWREQIGPTWDVLRTSQMAVAAVRILGRELREERERRVRELQVERERRQH